MRVASLAFRTDLFFPKFEGSVVDRGDYLVVTTPKNPTYHWGNFLLFASPPLSGDLGRWTELFHREIGAPERAVETHPEHRGQGIAGTLVHAAAQHALGKFDLERLVMVADEGSQAARIYTSVGFMPVEKSVGLARSFPG